MGKRFFKNKILFNRNEFSGAFGDIGTDLPLIMGMILTNKLEASNTFIMFGAMQILTAIIYGIPMAVQPLKAMATIMITQKLDKNLLYGAGFSIGIIMIILSFSNLLTKIGNCIPKSVIRGIQFGLGTSLSYLALSKYINSEGIHGFIFSILSFFIIILLIGNRKIPPAIPIIILGIIFSFFFLKGQIDILHSFKLAVPKFHKPTINEILIGFILLGLPQLPLSLSNSIFATNQTIKDLFPDKQISIRKIGFTYGIMNLINPFFGGVPTCHGAGGIAGHYTFGARTGGSLIIYGSFYLFFGFFFSNGISNLINIFPMPMLGVILFFEGISLMLLIKDLLGSKNDLFIALIVGMICLSINYGYMVGLIIGILIHYIKKIK